MPPISRYNEELTDQLVRAIESHYSTETQIRIQHSSYCRLSPESEIMAIKNLSEDTYNKMIGLISQGADPRVLDRRGNSFLHIAAKVNDIDVYKLDEIIVTHKLGLDSLNEKQESPLDIAVFHGITGVARYLVGAGATISDRLVRHVSREIDFPSNPWVPKVLKIFENSFYIRREYLHYRSLKKMDTLASRCAIVIRRRKIQVEENSIPYKCYALINPFKYARRKVVTI